MALLRMTGGRIALLRVTGREGGVLLRMTGGMALLRMTEGDGAPQGNGEGSAAVIPNLPLSFRTE